MPMLYEEPLEVNNENFDNAMYECEVFLVNGDKDICGHNLGSYHWHGKCEKCGSKDAYWIKTPEGEIREYTCMVRQCQAKFMRCEHFELLKEIYNEVGVIHKVN
jgi:hypothetical protein